VIHVHPLFVGHGVLFVPSTYHGNGCARVQNVLAFCCGLRVPPPTLLEPPQTR
jgi:hypothetical protein